MRLPIEMDQYYYAYTVPPPPNPIIPAGAVPPTDLIKFGRAQMERYFDNHGRYVDVRRRLEQLCGQLLLTGLNVQNPEDIAEFQTAVRMCVKYHFRMIASVRCRASGGCIDLLWRCGIQRINAINPPPFRINHNPIQNPATPWLRNGGSEFYQVLDAQGNVANADAGFDILHHALTQTLYVLTQSNMHANLSFLLDCLGIFSLISPCPYPRLATLFTALVTSLCLPLRPSPP